MSATLKFEVFGTRGISDAECEISNLMQCSVGVAITRGPGDNPTKLQLHASKNNESCFTKESTKKSYDCNTNTEYQMGSSQAAVQVGATLPTKSNGLSCTSNFTGEKCEKDSMVANLKVNNRSICDTSKPSSNNIVDTTKAYKKAIQTPADSKTLQESTGKVPSQPRPQLPVDNPEISRSHDAYYAKPSYVVLIGNTVRRCNTKLYASLPVQNKYMVKERLQDLCGITRVKLVLKASHER